MNPDWVYVLDQRHKVFTKEMHAHLPRPIAWPFDEWDKGLEVKLAGIMASKVDRPNFRASLCCYTNQRHRRV